MQSDALAGRPRIEVKKEEIESLRALNFSWTKIARTLGISCQTLYRRLQEFGIPCTDRSVMPSAEVDSVISEIKRVNPNYGEVMIQGRLTSLGIRLCRLELRESIHRVDHENIQQQRSHVLKRRQYSVDCPNSIWHIDSHHKLIIGGDSLFMVLLTDSLVPFLTSSVLRIIVLLQQWHYFWKESPDLDYLIEFELITVEKI